MKDKYLVTITSGQSTQTVRGMGKKSAWAFAENHAHAYALLTGATISQKSWGYHVDDMIVCIQLDLPESYLEEAAAA